MPKAEVGSTKHLANKMKAKGLQRLRWYCQICSKQCRDENGFKQHTQSEGHVRALLLVGEDPKKFIEDYSRQFQRDFLQLLKTSHGEKKVHMNHFYQEYIHDKEHVHMNATKWPSLTEFAKHLGREGICKVEEGDRGLEIQWVDDSAQAIQRREDVRKRDKLVKGDEDLEAKLLQRQIKQAREEAERAGRFEEPKRRAEGEEGAAAEPVKVSLSLGGSKAAAKQPQQAIEVAPDAPVEISTFSSAVPPAKPSASPVDDDEAETDVEVSQATSAPVPAPTEAPAKVLLSLGGSKPKHVNPLMAKKSSGNPLSKKKESSGSTAPEKKMSNAERIMREEVDRKRRAEEMRLPAKRPRMG